MNLIATSQRVLLIQCLGSIQSISRDRWAAWRTATLAVTRHGAAQRIPELSGLVGMVSRIDPQIVVEVGTRFGGTFSCWAVVPRADALLISIDLPEGEFGGDSGDNAIQKLQSFLREKQRLECLRQDSYLPESISWILESIQEKPNDLRLLDGDHFYLGIKQDFEMYGPLVRPGGLIAFHNIVVDTSISHIQVPKFWREIRERYRWREFIYPKARRDGGMGIGVISV